MQQVQQVQIICRKEAAYLMKDNEEESGKATLEQVKVSQSI